MRNNQPVTGAERFFDADVAIVSHSDPQGRITFVNDDLLRVSGFSAEELIGEAISRTATEESVSSLFD